MRTLARPAARRMRSRTSSTRVTYWFVGLYSLHKLAGMSLARDQVGNWRDVMLSTWTAEDMAILSMILTFWFVGRVWERARGA